MIILFFSFRFFFIVFLLLLVIAALTSLFKTNFRTDFPFDPQELLVFAFIGIACGFGGAAYVRCHRMVVHYIRNHKKLNSFLKKKYVRKQNKKNMFV